MRRLVSDLPYRVQNVIFGVVLCESSVDRRRNQAVVTGKFRNTMHPRRARRQVSEVLTTLRSPLPK